MRGWLIKIAGITGLLALTTSAVAVPASTRRASAATAPPARDFDRRLAQLDSQEDALEEEQRGLGPRHKTVKSRILLRGRYYYRMVRAGLLPVGGGFDALVDHAARVERVRTALSRDVRLERQLRERQVTIEEDLRELRAKRQPMLVQQVAMTRARAALRQAEERQAAFSRAFGTNATTPPGGGRRMAVYGGTGPVDRAGTTESFFRLRGRLTFPLEGRAELVHTGGAPDQEGLTLRSDRDTRVRAVHEGTVAFVGRTDRGETVVVDHGQSYFSVYSGFARVDVKKNDRISGRESLGWIVRRGANPAMLYIELRHKKALLDARVWLGL